MSGFGLSAAEFVPTSTHHSESKGESMSLLVSPRGGLRAKSGSFDGPMSPIASDPAMDEVDAELQGKW